MTAASAAPMRRVNARISAWARRLATRIGARCLQSIRLTDAEMQPPPARLRAAVHEQTVDWIQLPADVETDGPDRRLIAESRPHRVAEIAEANAAGFGPDVAGVEERHHPELAAQRRAQFFAEREHAVAADRYA